MKVMNRIFASALILMFILGSMTILKIYASPETPKIYVNPKDNIFSTGTTAVGDTFTVDIATSGWELPGLYGYELKLYYDPTLLNITETEYPTDHFLSTASNFPTPVIIDYEAGAALFGCILLGDVPGSTGSGVLATVTFQIIAGPPPVLSCDLELKDITLLDPDGNDITEYDVEHGIYEFSAPGPPVYLKVEPKPVSAAEIGDEVVIQVTINEMESALKLANVTFKLHYNTSLLSTKEEWISPGETYVWFNVTLEADYARVEIQMVTEAPFPEGKATLATITFNATHIPSTLTTSPLSFSDVVLTDIDGNTVQYDHLEDGLYQVPITTEKEDLNGDGKVNIDDLYVFALAFGSYPGHARWDSRADMNGDGRASVLDALLIAMKFHD
jgi:hypothetical protein